MWERRMANPLPIRRAACRADAPCRRIRNPYRRGPREGHGKEKDSSSIGGAGRIQYDVYGSTIGSQIDLEILRRPILNHE